MKQKFDVLPASIQKKIDAGKSLTFVDQEIINGLEEAKKALERPREERGPFEFKEEHELLMTFHGDMSLNDNIETDDDDHYDYENEDNWDGEDDEVDPEPEVKQPPVKNKKWTKQTTSREGSVITLAKKSSKTKGHGSHTDCIEREDDESDHNIDHNDDHDDDGDGEEEDGEEKEEGEEEEEKEKKEEEEEGEEEEEEDFQDAQYDDNDDDLDEDLEDAMTVEKRKQVSLGSGNKLKMREVKQQQQQQLKQQGADDVGAQDEPKSNAKQRRKLNRARTEKGSASNAVKDTPETDRKYTKSEKQRTPAEELKNWKGRAQRTFARNEKNMLPIMEKLESAIKKNAAAAIDAVLQDIRDNQIEDLANSFILGYDIVGRIKSCKGVIGKSNNYKAAMANMKAHFERNIGNEPPDFRPVKNEKGGVKN